MHRTLASAVLLAAVAGSLPGLAAAPDAVPFRTEELAPGVTLLTPADPSTARTNSLLVERQDGLLVIDAQPAVSAAKELLAVIGRISPKPVRYLAFSHPHAEAVGGATAFPSDTLVIGSRSCRDALADDERELGAEMRGRSEDPEAWVDPERRLPVLVVSSRVVLDDPHRRVEFRALVPSHSSGDMLVYLPGSDILYVGSLLFSDGNPYAEDATIRSWLDALNSISKRKPARIVGLHGPAVDVRAIRRNRDSFAWLRGRVEYAFVEQVPTERIRQFVFDSPQLGHHFDPDASPSFLPGVIDQVVGTAIENRRKRGLTF